MKVTFSKSLFLLAVCIVSLLHAPSSYAHPLGNFSVNHYSRITLSDREIEIRYILDLAFIAERAREFGRGLQLLLDGKSIPLHLISQNVIFPPGAGGLPTMKMGFVYRAAYPEGIHSSTANLTFEDQNYQGHQGWKEIIVSAPQELLVHSSVPAR